MYICGSPSSDPFLEGSYRFANIDNFVTVLRDWLFAAQIWWMPQRPARVLTSHSLITSPAWMGPSQIPTNHEIG